MKYLNILFTGLLLLFFSFNMLLAQTAENQYSRVKVNLEGKDIQLLASLGVETDHGIYRPGKFIINDYSGREVQKIRAGGFSVEILIPDVVEYYAHREHDHHHKVTGENCLPIKDLEKLYPRPENFEHGSMGGFLTYAELLEELDKMNARYPNIISYKKSISEDILSHEGRPILWVRISDNAETDEMEPEVLYTALHHAREPAGMMNLIWYMWHLLENYGTDEEITYLVDQTEMYFVPCINPDGYVFNEVNNPDGGGMWRKNRRDNGDGTHGVDLNRNYAYEWAYDDIGSSNDSESQVYRGPSAASEPETQCMEQICEEHQFLVALNYHTFGNLLIHPWGFSDVPTDDHDLFRAFGKILGRDNDYTFGTGSETVGYTVNGDSDDWMYGEEEIIAMTPEVGSGAHGFWPAADQIDGLCRENLWQNLMLPRLALKYLDRKVELEEVISSKQGELKIQVKRIGFQDGDIALSLIGHSSNIISARQSEILGLQQLEEREVIFEYELEESIGDGEEVVFLLSMDYGGYSEIDTIKTIFREESTGDQITVFEEDGNDLDSWESLTWGVTTERFYSANTAITDSPNEAYENEVINEIELSEIIDLTDAETSELSFWAQWDIEKNFDYVQLLAAEEFTENWMPLCGRLSSLGKDTHVDAENEPLWDGIQSRWVLETVSLDDFVGLRIKLKFSLTSDQFVNGDGFYFDDFKVSLTRPNVSSTVDQLEVSVLKITPNPGVDIIQFPYSLLKAPKIRITNGLGITYQPAQVTTDGEHCSLDIRNLEAGYYVISVGDDETGAVDHYKFLKAE